MSRFKWLKVGCVWLALFVAEAQGATVQAPAPSSSIPALPRVFEANQGQHERNIQYFSRGADYGVALTPTGALLSSRDGSRIELKFLGASSHPRVLASETVEHKTNYFLGEGTSYTDVPNFGRVTYADLYPGIDAAFYSRGSSVEYDLVLKAGANAKRIRLSIKGAKKLELDEQGNLLIHSIDGVFKQHKPQIYQEQNGQRTPIEGRYVLKGDTVRFALAKHDVRAPVVIDPVLSYSTYLGGNGMDNTAGVAVDAAGNAYIVGKTSSTDFPALNAYQNTLQGYSSVFVTKLNAQGTAAVFSTYIGGRSSDSNGRGIALDSAGNIYVAAYTSGSAYPTTNGAYSACARDGSGAVTKLSPAGNTLIYSTCLPDALPVGIAVDASGYVYLGGETLNFQTMSTTVGALQPTNPSPGARAGFFAKVNQNGSALVYSTYLGGSSETRVWGFAVDAQGNAYALGESRSADFPTTPGVMRTAPRGQDLFVSKINGSGTQLVYSTFLGGESNEDHARSIAVDASGRAYITAETYSTSFDGLPSVNYGNYRGLLAVLNPDATGLVFAEWLAPSVDSHVNAVAVDASGTHVYVGGYLGVNVSNLVDPIQPKLGAGYSAYVARYFVDPITRKPSIVYSTYLGGLTWVDRIAIDYQGNAYVTGTNDGSAQNSLPVTAGAIQKLYAGGAQDAFVAKLSTLGMPIVLSGGCGEGLGPVAQLRAMTALDATGSVSFMESGSTLATVPITNGVAMYTAPTSIGVHKYTAIRSSDSAASAPLYCKVDQ